MKKNKISFEERLKIVFSILILLVALIFIESRITGLVIKEKQYNYLDKFNLEFNATDEYIWNPQNQGLLESIKLSGSFDSKGSVKAFLEFDSERYLIFDSANIASDNLIDFSFLENNLTNSTAKLILEYKNDSEYDINNDGIENLSGVIDLTVENSKINATNLCTLWNVFSYETKEETYICYGDNDCCNNLGLASSSSNWDDVFYSYYGQYGATKNNIVFAQVYSLNNFYTDKKSLTVQFYDTTTSLENVCEETCSIQSFNSTNYRLIFEVENSSLKISEIKYDVTKHIFTNNAPELIKSFSNITINNNYSINLSQYFSDPDNDLLNFDYYKTENVDVVIEEEIATIVPSESFRGNIFLFFKANDSLLTEVSNVFKIEVIEESVIPSDKKFDVTNAVGEIIASIDESGNMFIKESLSQDSQDLAPSSGSFIIQNSLSEPVSYIDSNGSLFLSGTLFEESVLSFEENTFQIRDSKDYLAAYFDLEGNLKLKGRLYQNYENP